jgi:hypothetical protein
MPQIDTIKNKREIIKTAAAKEKIEKARVNKFLRTRMQIVVLKYSTPVNVHTTYYVLPILKRYWKKEFNKEMSKEQEAKLIKNAKNLIANGKTSIGSYTFLQVEPEDNKDNKDK